MAFFVKQQMISVVQHHSGRWFLALNPFRVNGLLSYEYAWTGISWAAWAKGEDLILFFESEESAQDHFKLNVRLIRAEFERISQSGD